MKRATVSLVSSLLLIGGLVAAVPASAQPKPGPDRFDVYTGEVANQQVQLLTEAGAAREDLALSRAAKGRVRVEAVLSPTQVAKLRTAGVNLQLKKVDGKSAADTLATQQADGVFRPYSGAGGLREEIVAAANAKPGIAKVVDVGTSVQGKPITAIKVTKGGRSLPDGKRPGVVYMSTQHAREWITPEMTRRLLHHYLDSYGTNPEITRIVDTTEVWFLVVANPDGYDWTFQPGQRMWRKNLRDNNGDGQISTQDGVDPNRNFPYKFGYDNEGSSPDFPSDTYRGSGPASEPETRALLNLMRRGDFTYAINWHSAAELLLYGVGWQQATPTPDDVLFEAFLGDDEHPAVPGYDPDIGAELYTTNGETDGQLSNEFDTLAITPEMSTCETVSAGDPDDEWDPADCASVFTFPDDETLIQAEYAKNVPFAIAAARSVHDPDHPVSVVGRTVPDFSVDKFGVSYGSTQPVASVIRRSLRDKAMRFRINGGSTRSSSVSEWRGGEKYGDENDIYFAEYRGKVTGARPGDRVEVWFQGKRGRNTVSSEHFTYRVRSKGNARVLVVANEDYKGVNPGPNPSGATAPKYAQTYVDALGANRLGSRVWDVTAEGVPHDLGVLSHFDAVVWYQGDNRLTQDPEDFLTEVFGDNVEDASVAEREHFLTIAIRDYLNEGGRLLNTAETAGYYGVFESAVGGIWYAIDGHPDQQCQVTFDPFSDCLLLADDFRQYYLGAINRAARQNPTAFIGAGRLDGTETTFGGAPSNPLNEAGNFGVTSDFLPPDEFPQFRGAAGGQFVGEGGPFDPVEGDWYAAAPHSDSSYMRLMRTVDLSSVTAGQTPKLEFQLSFETEPGFDNVIVEAHTVGQDNWTTLPDLNGGTDTGVPDDCEGGFYTGLHPWLLHYLTQANPCGNTGTTGAWNRFTGSSGGWQPVAVDLSAYAGQQVELSISYVTDPAVGGIGAFVDDTKVTAGGTTLDSEGFETGLGPWTTPGPPPDSPAASDFQRGQSFGTAAVTTRDTVLFGFGIEQAGTPAERAAVIGKAMDHLLR